MSGKKGPWTGNRMTLGKQLELVQRVGYFLPRTLFATVSDTISRLEGLLLICESFSAKSILAFCKNSHLLQGKLLMDLWVSDYPKSSRRFQVTYSVLSMRFCTRLYVRTFLKDYELIDSVTSLFSSSGWLEREANDMFGVCFRGHSDLRRILTDYGFSGYPLRKDFPLTGFVEVRYDDEVKRVVQEAVDVIQEYRYFDYISPWDAVVSVNS